MTQRDCFLLLVCDLVGRPLRFKLSWSKTQIADTCYTITIATMIAAGLVVLHALGTHR